MEIYKGVRGNNAKVYESEWFTNDPNHIFNPIEITDGHLCNGNPEMEIEIKFINRNQFKMENKEICYISTTFK